jgi:hypothetical protein
LEPVIYSLIITLKICLTFSARLWLIGQQYFSTQLMIRKKDTYYNRPRLSTPTTKYYMIYFLNVSIFSLLLTLPPSALGVMSIFTAIDAYFTRYFDSTRRTTGMDVKLNNKWYLERMSCRPTRLSSKNGGKDFFFIVIRFGETSACCRNTLYNYIKLLILNISVQECTVLNSALRKGR